MFRAPVGYPGSSNCHVPSPTPRPPVRCPLEPLKPLPTPRHRPPPAKPRACLIVSDTDAGRSETVVFNDQGAHPAVPAPFTPEEPAPEPEAAPSSASATPLPTPLAAQRAAATPTVTVTGGPDEAGRATPTAAVTPLAVQRAPLLRPPALAKGDTMEWSRHHMLRDPAGSPAASRHSSGSAMGSFSIPSSAQCVISSGARTSGVPRTSWACGWTLE